MADGEIATPSGGSVVRLLRAAPNRRLRIAKLCKSLKAGLKADGLEGVLSRLEQKGRITNDGDEVVLIKRKKSKCGDEIVDEPASKRMCEDLSAKHISENTTFADGGTRVFLGNLSFKIDEKKLMSAIPGITHIKWVTDKETQKFYGSAFIELATSRDAMACVAMAGSNILGRPLKANLAPPRPGDMWPPDNVASSPGRGARDSTSTRTPSEKPFEGCRTLFLGNLSYSIEESHLIDFFVECGAIAKVRWLTHEQSGDFKGCGYVEFWDTQSADAAVLLNGSNLLGRPVRIDWDAGGRSK